MPKAIVLDTFPISSMGRSEKSSADLLTTQCRDWVYDCIAAGNKVYVPAICYYEALRELTRIKAYSQIIRLRNFCYIEPSRFLLLTTNDLEGAATLWAQARSKGVPTASPDALDVDVILAAQALALGLPESDLVIATTNVGHLSRFVPADDWQKIAPGS